MILDPNQSSLGLRNSLQANVKTLLAARLAVVSFFMGLVVFYQYGFGIVAHSIPALLPVGAAYILTIVYAVIFRLFRRLNLFLFVYVQLFIDLALITSIIYCTGGVNSPFSFLFVLVIIAAAIFIWQSATYIIATAASVIYGSILALEYWQVIQPYFTFPPVYDPSVGGYVFMTGVMRIALFYLVAYLSGYLTYLLRRTDEQLVKKSEDFTLLEAFHKRVVNSMGSGLLAVDMDGVILSHNPAAEKILRLSSDEINRQRIEMVLKLPSMRRFLAYLDVLEGDSRQYDWVYKKGGERINLNMTMSKFVVDKSIRGAIAVFHDVTNLKKMERQVADAERLAAIGRVAAGIAHEIRNPLASLSGSIQMLRGEMGSSLDNISARLMDISIRETDRLNHTITEFLGYASPPKVAPERVDLTKMLSETVTLLKANPDYRDKIVIKENVDEGLFLYADMEQLRQIMWNLCVNAIDAMDNRGELTLRAKKSQRPHERRQKPRTQSKTPVDEPLDFIKITVGDTGQGIPQENHAKIFEPFFTTKKRGTGLGLSTVHKIIESHGGRITLSSEQGKGTEFKIWLPIEPSFKGEIIQQEKISS